MTPTDTAWTPALQALWQRLLEHDFGTADCALTFQARLAREQGWSEAQAAAALLEYRRFCFLAVASGHHVSPSDAVDEVWHQHLTYSRDYWTRFCPQVLGADLHHEPTRGGREQSRKHYRQYAETLASYQRFFGPPSAGWWPDARGYSASPARYQRVDLTRHWLLPRPRLPRLAAAQLALAGVLLLTAPWLQALPLNPLELPGPQFLLLFLALFAVAFVASRLLRHRFSATRADAGAASLADPWSIAYLAGGPARVVDTGIATLLAEDRAEWKDGKLHVRDLHSVKDSPLREIARASASGQRVRDIVKILQSYTTRLHESLQQRGLMLDSAQRQMAGLWGALPYLALTVFGIAKIQIGIARERPVFFLVLLVIVSGIATLVAWLRRPQRSTAGEALLRSLNQRHAHARRAPRDGDIGLAVALGGTAILAGTAFASYHDYRAPQSSSSSDSGCSSSDSGCSSGDSGGGGCGGCGGGGD
jgi:uncharacterized protein (TIGR04222 family)